MVMLKTVSSLLTVMVDSVAYMSVIGRGNRAGAARAFRDGTAGYQAAGIDRAVAHRGPGRGVPQQPVLQSAVLASLKVAVAFNWTVASSLIVAVTGAMDTLETVSVFVTVIVEVLLT